MEQVTAQPSTAPASGGSRARFLADAKRFNAQQIRRRMKEQKLRFSPKTNAGADAETTAPQTNSNEKPRLTIAVSMSEDQEDIERINKDERSSSVSSESISGNDRSAWAMMEHYQLLDTSMQQKAETAVINSGRTNAAFWDKSLTLESLSLAVSPDASTTTSQLDYDMSSQLQIFLQNGNSIHRHSPPAIGNALVGTAFTPSTALVQPVTPPTMGEDSVNEQGLWQSAVKDPRPTPARLRDHWIEEKENDLVGDSPPTSLLQESLILSDGPSTAGSAFRTVIPKGESGALSAWSGSNPLLKRPLTVKIDDSSFSQASMIPHDQSQSVLGASRIEHLDIGTNKTRAVTLPGNHEADTIYLKKIQKLEDDLRQQKGSTDEMESKLKERVVELEQALRATVATPRGTIIQENPLKTLLDRNQTLVKEVRFADSTCVELSTKIAAMEAEKKIMRDQLAALEEENKDLRTQRSDPLVEPPISDSPQAKDSYDQISSYSLNASSDEGSLKKVIEELKAEVSALAQEKNPNVSILSSASVLLTDIDDLGIQEDGNLDANKSNASYCLAKALQLQVELMREQNKMVSRNKHLEHELAVARTTKGTDENGAYEPDEHARELQKAQEEGNFLGRQLGIVQGKLDAALQELQDERSRSEALDNTFREEATGRLERIQYLEDLLESATSRLNQIDCDYAALPGVPPVHALDGVETELSDVKASLALFKTKLEEMLTNQLFGDDLSSEDQQSQMRSIMEIVMNKMKRQFARLNMQVEEVVASQCERLEKLSETVRFLRSSLLFETESVSTDSHHPSTDSKNQSATDSSGWKEIADDDMYERMEEARAQNAERRDVSSDVDDLSRLFTDDSTLESVLKASPGGVFVGVEALKKSVEAAVRECQRVKGRSIALKEELQSEKFAFSQLEAENQRVMRDLSRSKEEKTLLQEALDEARAQVDFLEKQAELHEENLQTISAAKLEVEQQLADLGTENHTLAGEKTKVESELAGLETKLSAVQEQLRESHVALDAKGKECESLRLKMDESQSKAAKAEDMMLESRYDQQRMRKERAELRSSIAKSEQEIQGIQAGALELKTNFDKELTLKNDKISDLQDELQSTKAMMQQYSIFFEEMCSIAKNSRATIPFNYAAWETTKSDGSSHLDRATEIVKFLSVAISKVSETEDINHKYLQDVERSKEESEQLREMFKEYKQQAEDEKSQNFKLLELLRQAELEMERSANQIRELSSAMSKLQLQESELGKRAKAAESENDIARKELERTKQSRIEEKNSAQHQMNSLLTQLKEKEAELTSSHATVELFETKNGRLREYVKKLTIKCEEWESSYSQQGKIIEKLQAKNARLRHKASAIASKYKSLSEHLQCTSKVRTEDMKKWDVERTDLQEVQAQLERELETITEELSNLNKV